MFHLVQILTIVFVGIALSPALAHAFEFPGKKRLNRETYVTVQTIYYPGFTLLGVAEPVGLIAAIVLLLLTPRETASFWLTLVASIGLLGMQLVYWTFTHPTNKSWLQAAGTTVGDLGAGFFAFDPAGRSASQTNAGWTKLRDRWEYSHIARAALAFLSFLLVVVAIVIQT
jgi:hypothetical protein